MKVKSIIGKKLCIGCGLCISNSNNKMVYRNGFNEPHNTDFKIDNLSKLCPGIYIRGQSKLKNNKSLFGSYLDIKCGYSKISKVRNSASSGGVITQVCIDLIEQGKADCIVHAGQSRSNPFESVRYISNTKDEILERCGSRYSPVVMLENIEEIFNKYEKIVFVGKPCDVAGLRNFLELNKKLQSKLYCCISFFCMGTPSINASYHLREVLEITDPVLKIDYRGNGWPGKTTLYTEESKYSLDYENSWGQILGRNLHFRCKICPDGFGEFADISVGDAWYHDNNGPIFTENEGRSVIFVRTERGSSIIKSEKIYLENYDVEDLFLIQKSQIKRKKFVKYRYLIVKLILFWRISFKNIFLKNNKNSSYLIIKDVLGFLYRIVKGSKRNESSF